jgi:hypothetical protein
MENQNIVSQMENQNILDNNYSKTFIKLSSLTFLSGIIATYYEKYDMAFLVYLAMFNTINYWRKPIYGLRRNFDIFVIVSGQMYHMYHSSDYELCHYYYFFTLLSFLSFPIGWYYHINKNILYGYYLHILLTIFTNFGLIALYISDKKET